MVQITDLLLASVAAAVAVFVVSSVVHMCFRYHVNDFGKMPDEDRTMDAIRGAGVPVGVYRFPYFASMKDLEQPEMKARYEKGPAGYLHVVPGNCGMGKSLGQWFAMCLVVSLGAAWLGGQCLAPGAAFADVFRITAVASFLAYGVSPVTESIWKGVPWCVCAKFIFDGLLYAAATGGVLAWLWPAAA